MIIIIIIDPKILKKDKKRDIVITIETCHNSN